MIARKQIPAAPFARGPCSVCERIKMDRIIVAVRFYWPINCKELPITKSRKIVRKKICLVGVMITMVPTTQTIYQHDGASVVSYYMLIAV